MARGRSILVSVVLETDMRRIKLSDLDEAAYGEIIRLLSDGGVVCMPTDTVYGLAVDAANEQAIQRLYLLKGRPRTLPIILLVDSLETARGVCHPPLEFDAIAAHFWPGPVTFVLEARPEVPRQATAGSGTIAVRWPDSAFVTRIVGKLGRPITSTSANLSGQPVAASADAAAAALPEVDLIVDGGSVPRSKPSTLIDLTSSPPVLLREGPVSWSEVSDFFAGKVVRRSA